MSSSIALVHERKSFKFPAGPVMCLSIALETLFVHRSDNTLQFSRPVRVQYTGLADLQLLGLGWEFD